MDHKYTVCECENDSTIYNGDDPKEALMTWINNARRFYTTITILAKTRAAELELMQTFKKNEIEFISRMHENGVPYKMNYITDGVNSNLEGRSKIQWEGDQVFPFCYG